MNKKTLKGATRKNINLDAMTAKMLEKMAEHRGISQSQMLREIIKSGLLEEALTKGLN